MNGNLNLSRSIGDLKYKANSGLPPADQMITAEPDLKLVEVTDEDQFMILACDGVWDCMTSQEVRVRVYARAHVCVCVACVRSQGAWSYVCAVLRPPSPHSFARFRDVYCSSGHFVMHHIHIALPTMTGFSDTSKER